MKKKIIFIISIVIFVAFVLVMTNQVLFVADVSTKSVKCSSWDATYNGIVTLADKYTNDKLEDDEHAYSFNGELPSNNPEDYMSFDCSFEVDNNSIFDDFAINATLAGTEKYKENILFVSDANSAMIHNANKMDKTTAWIVLYVYTGNLTDEQIRELANNLSVTVKLYGKYLGTRTKTISFEKCDNISIERLCTN